MKREVKQETKGVGSTVQAHLSGLGYQRRQGADCGCRRNCRHKRFGRGSWGWGLRWQRHSVVPTVARTVDRDDVASRSYLDDDLWLPGWLVGAGLAALLMLCSSFGLLAFALDAVLPTSLVADADAEHAATDHGRGDSGNEVDVERALAEAKAKKAVLRSVAEF